MVVKISNFGDILMSRPAGREDFLKARAYLFKDVRANDEIILDFGEVKVLAPSWANEFISSIKTAYPNSVQFINTKNPSVEASLKAILV